MRPGQVPYWNSYELAQIEPIDLYAMPCHACWLLALEYTLQNSFEYKYVNIKLK